MKRNMIWILVVCLMMSTLLSACMGGNNETNSETDDPGTTDDPVVSEGSEGGDGDGEADPVTQEPAFSMIDIEVLGHVPTGSRAPVEDVLTPIWREKTKVRPEIISIPSGTESTQWFQMQIVGDTLPDVLSVNGVFDNPDIFELLKQSKALREITLEDMKNHMPLLAERAEKYGVSLEQIYKDNVSLDGKLWFVPGGFSVQSSPYTQNSRMGDSLLGVLPYFQYVRDDILKKVLPEAKTEQELVELYREKGNLTYEDATGDLPIHNRAELFDFLMKIKELELEVDGKPLIPFHPSMNADVSSLMWSAFSLAGFWWQEGSFGWKDDQWTYLQGTPQWKEYIRWINKAYNAGFMDKEHFIQKDQQRTSKVINGRYAVFQQWQPVNDAREYAEKNGKDYGYRLIPMFVDFPLENEYQTNQYQGMNLGGGFSGVGITSSLPDEHFEQVLRWIDWNMSEEADKLRFWGPEGKFYTGEGENRRFKPEYKELEDWAVRGEKGGKDGIYYGMFETPYRANDYSAWNHETYGIRSFRYPEQPYYVYPEAERNSGEINIDNEILESIRQHYKKQLVFYERNWNYDDVDPENKFAQLSKRNGWDSEKGKTAIADAIIGSPDQFDENYARYEETFGEEFRAYEAEMQQNWEKIYNEQVKPAIEKAHSGQ